MRKTSFWDIATIISVGTIVALGGAAGLQGQSSGKDQSRLLLSSVAILPPGVFSRPSTKDDLLSSPLPAVKGDRLVILKQALEFKAALWRYEVTTTTPAERKRGIYRI